LQRLALRIQHARRHAKDSRRAATATIRGVQLQQAVAWRAAGGAAGGCV